MDVNRRQLFVKVDCNLEEIEHVLLTQCFIVKYVSWQTM